MIILNNDKVREREGLYLREYNLLVYVRLVQSFNDFETW